MMLTDTALKGGRVELAVEMALTSRRWRKLVDEHLRVYGLTYSRWQVLVELASAPLGLNQRELAERLAIEPASLVSQLDALGNRGLIERSAAPGDRRANRVLPTPGAHGLSGQVAAIVDELRAWATAGIGEDELIAATRVLRKIASNLEQK